jgi:sulfate transport system permease protein
VRTMKGRLMKVSATTLAALMLIISFAILLTINLIQAWSRRRYGYGG